MSSRDCVNFDIKFNYCVIKCVYVQGSDMTFLSLLSGVKSFNRFHDSKLGESGHLELSIFLNFLKYTK